MQTGTIQNVAGAFGDLSGARPDAQLVAEVVNNSGGSLAAGDVVIIDVTGTLATTTTTASHKGAIGVVAPRSWEGSWAADTYAAGATMPVVVYGWARVNIGANTVAALDNLATSGTVKQAAVPAAAATVAALQALVGSFIGVALEASGAKDANNTIRAFVNKM